MDGQNELNEPDRIDVTRLVPHESALTNVANVENSVSDSHMETNRDELFVDSGIQLLPSSPQMQENHALVAWTNAKLLPLLNGASEVVTERLPDFLALLTETDSSSQRRALLEVLCSFGDHLSTLFVEGKGVSTLKAWLSEAHKSGDLDAVFWILKALEKLPAVPQVVSLMEQDISTIAQEYQTTLDSDRAPLLSSYAQNLLDKWKQRQAAKANEDKKRKKMSIIDGPPSGETKDELPAAKRPRHEIKVRRTSAPLGPNDIKKRKELEKIARELKKQDDHKSGVVEEEEPAHVTDSELVSSPTSEGTEQVVVDITATSSRKQETSASNTSEQQKASTGSPVALPDESAVTTEPSKQANPSRKRKRVSWAAEDKLTTVRFFRKSESVTGKYSVPPEARGGSATDGKKSDQIMLAAQKERDHMSQLRKYEEEQWKLSRKEMKPTIPWRRPEKFAPMEDWVKKEGQDSKQAAIQEEHTNKEYMAAYLKPSDIPPTPKENREQYKAYDDDEIINIPFVDVKKTEKPKAAGVDSAHTTDNKTIDKNISKPSSSKDSSTDQPKNNNDHNTQNDGGPSMGFGDINRLKALVDTMIAQQAQIVNSTLPANANNITNNETMSRTGTGGTGFNAPMANMGVGPRGVNVPGNAGLAMNSDNNNIMALLANINRFNSGNLLGIPAQPDQNQFKYAGDGGDGRGNWHNAPPIRGRGGSDRGGARGGRFMGRGYKQSGGGGIRGGGSSRGYKPKPNRGHYSGNRDFSQSDQNDYWTGDRGWDDSSPQNWSGSGAPRDHHDSSDSHRESS